MSILGKIFTKGKKGLTSLGLEEIRGTIPEGAVIVEYYEARGTILACVLGPDRLSIVPVSLASRVRHLRPAQRNVVQSFHDSVRVWICADSDCPQPARPQPAGPRCGDDCR